MEKGNGEFEKEIENMNPNLKLIEYVDIYDTGKVIWRIKDSIGNGTPLFENDINILPINKNSCLLVGQSMGDSKLYLVNYHEENGLFYRILKHKDIDRIENVDDQYAIITSNKGQCFFDKYLLSQTSDDFTKLHKKGDCWVYENEYCIDNLSITIIGVVSEDGKIDHNAFQLSSLSGAEIVVPPLMETEKDYDVFDNLAILSSLDKEIEKYYLFKENIIEEAANYGNQMKKKM